MNQQKDFKELLELFNKNSVEYVVVGAYALAFHGCPRYTGDLDLLINPSEENSKKVLKSLHEFGFASLDLTSKDFTSLKKVIQLGLPPVRIDLLTSLTALTWDQISANKIKGDYVGTPIYFIGKDDLIINKKALGRHKDLADIESITE